MIKIKIALAAFALLALTPFARAEISAADMNKLIDQTNFLVGDGCSGTLISAEQRLILTANHCVSGLRKTIDDEKIEDDGHVKPKKILRWSPGTVSQIFYKDGSIVETITYTIKVIAAEKDRDLALLQVTSKFSQPHIAAKFACAEPTRLDAVYVVGNPYGRLYSSVVKGIVSSMDRDYEQIGVDDQGEHALMQVSAGVIGGNSGGATYNANGEFIGVPVRTNRVNEIIGLVVPLHDVKAFLTEHKYGDLFKSCDKDSK